MKQFKKLRSTCIYSSIELLFFSFLMLSIWIILSLNTGEGYWFVVVVVLFVPLLCYVIFWILLITNVCLYFDNKYKLYIVLINIFVPFIHFVITLIFWNKLFELNEDKSDDYNILVSIKKSSIISFIFWIICIVSVIVNSIFEIEFLTNLSVYNFFNVFSAIMIFISLILVFIYYPTIVCEAKLLDKDKNKRIKTISYIPLANSIIWALIR